MKPSRTSFLADLNQDAVHFSNCWLAVFQAQCKIYVPRKVIDAAKNEKERRAAYEYRIYNSMYGASHCANSDYYFRMVIARVQYKVEHTADARTIASKKLQESTQGMQWHVRKH